MGLSDRDYMRQPLERHDAYVKQRTGVVTARAARSRTWLYVLLALVVLNFAILRHVTIDHRHWSLFVF